MGDIVIIFFLQNVVIFSLIFWFLTWAGGFFFKKKNHTTKRNFYECGFSSLTDIHIQINLNFALLCIFLILYDIEFTFLFPILFNLHNVTLLQFFFFFLFVLAIGLSLLYDWQVNALSWQY